MRLVQVHTVELAGTSSVLVIDRERERAERWGRMDGISPTFLNGVGVVGVVLFLMIAFIRGWFVTRREADVYIKRAEDAEAARDRALEQNAELMEWARLGKATFKSLREAAEEPR